MVIETRNIEVCFTPALYSLHHNEEAIVVVVDILRATTSICTAFMNGARAIIPVAGLEEARKMKDQGYLVAAERDGIVRDFADLGNSPFNFTSERVNGNEIVYSTTNGTHAIELAQNSYLIAIGSYLNIGALSKFIIEQKRDVVIFCAGWKEKFNLEDSIFAGALSEKLLESGNYHTKCDATHASLDLWSIAKKNLMSYIHKTAQQNRLKKNGLDDSIEYCHRFDLTTIIPVLQGNRLIDYHYCEKINKFSEKRN